MVSLEHANLATEHLHEAKRHKANVRAASTANVTLASAVENGDTLDGVTLATGDRILLKDQSTGSQNGIYVVAASGTPARATDADSADELSRDFLVAVEEGITNGSTLWMHTTTAAITLGTTALTFAQVGAGGGGSGTVTSVALTAPAEFSVAGSPVTTSGTLAISKANQTANQVYAGPTSGGAAAPAFRALVAGDIPAIAESGVTNLTTDLAAKAPIASPTFTGTVTAPFYVASGLTGAVSASRYVGATASAAPATGTFAVGDFVITQTGKIYVCTTAGSPGTWTQVGAGGAASMTIEELDASPSVSATTLKFPNGTLTDNGSGSVTYTPAGGGGSSPVFKQTILQGNGNKTTSSSTFVAVDSTNLAFLTLTGLAVNDVVRCTLVAQVYNSSSSGAAYDFEVDRPTSANHRVYEACDSGAYMNLDQGLRSSLALVAHYVVGETGDHGFRPVWKAVANTQTMTNASSGSDDSAILFSVEKLGPVTA